MIEKIRLDNILFLDIETVPLEENFNSLDDEMKQLWEQKTQYQRKEEFTAEEFYDRAGTVSYTHLDVYKRQGEGEPIVDPSQYEVMKANFALTKTFSDEELQSLEQYIYSQEK